MPLHTITVSRDFSVAVREDGMRLTAVPAPESGGRCDGCLAFRKVAEFSQTTTCTCGDANGMQHCNGGSRRPFDDRNIIWVKQEDDAL